MCGGGFGECGAAEGVAEHVQTGFAVAGLAKCLVDKCMEVAVDVVKVAFNGGGLALEGDAKIEQLLVLLHSLTIVPYKRAHIWSTVQVYELQAASATTCGGGGGGGGDGGGGGGGGGRAGWRNGEGGWERCTTCFESHWKLISATQWGYTRSALPICSCLLLLVCLLAVVVCACCWW